MGASYKYLELILSLTDQEVYSPATIAAFGVANNLNHGEPKARVQNTLVRFGRKIKEQWPDVPKDGQTGIGTSGFYGVRWKAALPPVVVGEPRHAEMIATLQRLTQPEVESKKATDSGLPLWSRLSFIAALLLFVLVLVPRFLQSDQPLAVIDRLQKQGDISQLRHLLDQQGFLQLRHTIMQAISQTHHRLGHQAPSLSGMDQIQAVFAFERNPMILAEDQVFQLGDLLAIGGEAGYLTDIRPARLTMETERGSVGLTFPRVAVFGHSNWRAFPVTVYGQGENLETVLAAVCHVTGRTWMADSDVAGTIVGSLESLNYDEFLHEIAPHVAVEVTPDHLALLVTREPRGYVGFTRNFFKMHTEPLSKILDRYGKHLGYEIVLHSPDREVMLAPTQLSRLCEDLNLEMKVNHQQRYAEISDRISR